MAFLLIKLFTYSSVFFLVVFLAAAGLVVEALLTLAGAALAFGAAFSFFTLGAADALASFFLLTALGLGLLTP